jgi:predicted nucleotidyltransferase
MMELLKKCVGFRVLEFFLSHSSDELHLKDIARRVEISPSSAKLSCDALVKDGIIIESRKGNLRLFRLNSDDFAVKEMMKAFYILLIKKLGIEGVVEGNASLAIYGSFASGDFDELSDLDLLVVGEESEVNRNLVLQLQENLGREIHLTVIPYHRWEMMKKTGDRFAESILRHHMLVRGAGL